ncbi:MAG: phosphate transport system regulatory protein PhoU [Deltaproteobacteria bacterium RIFOXYD12_FULL_57_12]|nr:MAG: phosphate transport system regulatory protein PhoU [Deltaproteobacteria bacterium RIFOXYD12_FULL_57_12]
MSKHLQRDIEKLKAKLIHMGEVIEDRVYQATMSVIKHEPAMAQAVIRGDAEIDAMEVEIEEDCLKILALYQPVAIDLRFIIAVLKINNDLERVGDLAVNVAERGAFLATQEGFKMVFDVYKMAVKAEGMLTRSIDSLVNMDVRQARQVRAEDDEMDTLNREMYALVKEVLPQNSDQMNCLFHAVSIGRHLERIADHATNIAEDVVYMVEAEIIRHRPEVFEE